MIQVDSSVNCKLFLKTTYNGSSEIQELMLTQVFNYKLSENKRPVYGFNQKDFSQVIRGKRLFEGIIVIKKSSISDMNKLLSSIYGISDKDVSYARQKVEYLESTLTKDKTMQNKLDEYYKRALYDAEVKRLKRLNNSDTLDVLNDMPEGTTLILSFGDTITSKEFQEKLTYTELTDVNSLTNLMNPNSNYIVEDIHFFEKTGEVSVGKNDIDEVYKFFGRLKQWEDNK